MTLVWYWHDLWANWEVNIHGLAIRRATVVTGRENVAGALSKTDFFSRLWLPFLHEIQGSLRDSEVHAEQLNLSAMFATRIAGRADELASEAASSPWTSGLGVDVDEMKRRIGDMHPQGRLIGSRTWRTWRKN